MIFPIPPNTSFGRGKAVFYAAISQEDATHLQKMVSMFKEENLNWGAIQVVVIDKDFTEWNILKSEFPNAVILIVLSMACH